MTAPRCQRLVRFSNARQYQDIRQIIASVLGDLDGLIALEEKKHPNQRYTVGVAQRLFEAGRNEEALTWVRLEPPSGLLDDILARARSKAYPHAARYSMKLDQTAAASNAETLQIEGVALHAAYLANLKKTHKEDGLLGPGEIVGGGCLCRVGTVNISSGKLILFHAK